MDVPGGAPNLPTRSSRLSRPAAHGLRIASAGPGANAAGAAFSVITNVLLLLGFLIGTFDRRHRVADSRRDRR